MTQQNFERLNNEIRERFLAKKAADPERFSTRLNLSWSNWGFGMEPLRDSVARLAAAEIPFIELHGNHYGADLGYRPEETLRILGDHGIQVGGICGMFSAENDLSSNSAISRQRAIDYLKRTIDFAVAVGAGYILVVPGAVGRSHAYDDMEFARSTETLHLVADRFVAAGVKAAIEPIRSAEVSFVHTIADAIAYIEALAHPGVQHINADVYHMQVEERHIGAALLDAGQRLTNIHMADSNRGALGDGALDLDTIIRALYVIGYNRPGCYVTPEPLGPGGDPYPAMYGKPEPTKLNYLVQQTAQYFRAREEAVLSEG
ncbi:MAG TPA: sugar phosphate isomerase/epimerase family protein [Armatimonadota bacterium]|jgi:sugar phosphate isomerase/epimerase